MILDLCNFISRDNRKHLSGHAVRASMYKLRICARSKCIINGESLDRLNRGDLFLGFRTYTFQN